MSIKLHWFLPTTGDAGGLVGGGHGVPQGVGRPARRPAPPTGSASPTSTTSPTIARTAEQLGFEGVLTPTGAWCEDAWLPPRR